MKANIILEGGVGTGKTTSLITIPKNKKVFVLCLEPGIQSILGDTDPEQFHWAYLPPAKPDWDSFLATSTMLSNMSAENVKKHGGIRRQDYLQFLELIEFCRKPVDQRSGKSLPPLDELSDEWVIAMDGLTGLSTMVSTFIVGAKPCMSWPEFEISMNTLKQFVDLFVFNAKASFILLSHVEKEVDQITGGTNLTVSTIGAKLAPKLIRPFDDVIYTYRPDKDHFYWSTCESGIDGKSRHLPLSDKLPADFGQIFKD